MNMTTVPHVLSMAENISVGVRPAISMTRPPMILPSVPPRPSVTFSIDIFLAILTIAAIAGSQKEYKEWIFPEYITIFI